MNQEEMISVPKSVITDALMHSSKELQRQRRAQWIGKFIKFSLIGGLVTIGYLGAKYSDGGVESERSADHLGYIRVYGEVKSGGLADADRIIPAVKSAFEAKNCKAVVLRINSPGGSPVQASRVFKEITYLKKQYPQKPLVAFIEDLGASAAYYIAVSADKIIVNENSMVGSIGVISSGFGFTDVMSKVGVERRIITSGEHKAIFDPFSAEDKYVKEFFSTKVLPTIHQQFISAVKEGRGDRLKTDQNLFSGLIWVGDQAVTLGLADGVEDIRQLSRDTLAGKVNMVDYTRQDDVLTSFANKATASFINNVTATFLTPTLN